MFRVPFNIGGVYRRRGGEGRGGVVARCVVERRRSVHGRIRIIDFEGSADCVRSQRRR